MDYQDQRRCTQCRRLAMWNRELCWHCLPPDERPPKGENRRAASRERMRLIREDQKALGLQDQTTSGTKPGHNRMLASGPSAGAAGAAVVADAVAGLANQVGAKGYDVRAVLWRLARNPKATATARASAARTLAEMDGIIGKHQQAPERASDATLATLSRGELAQELARLRASCARDKEGDHA